VATVSRIDKIIGLFCRILSHFQGSFAKETYHLIDPTKRSHPKWYSGESIVLKWRRTKCVAQECNHKTRRNDETFMNRYRVAKTHSMPEVAGRFPQKSR